MTSLVEWTLYNSEINVFFCSFKNCQPLKNTNDYANKVRDKSKTTQVVGIV